MKACKDCVFYRSFWLFQAKAAVCNHKAARKPEQADPETGKITPAEQWSVAVMRMHSDEHCGFEGKLWVKK